jgi:hypothetical protein
MPQWKRPTHRSLSTLSISDIPLPRPLIEPSLTTSPTWPLVLSDSDLYVWCTRGEHAPLDSSLPSNVQLGSMRARFVSLENFLN